MLEKEINLVCAGCGSEETAAAAIAGESTKCGKCGERCKVPFPGIEHLKSRCLECGTPHELDDVEECLGCGETDALQRYCTLHDTAVDKGACLVCVRENPRGTDMTEMERRLALLCHFSPLLVGFLGPLVFWLHNRDKSSFVDHHGKEALNVHLTVLLAALIPGGPIFMYAIGYSLLPAVILASVVYSILAAVAAHRGEWYKFPYSIRLIK